MDIFHTIPSNISPTRIFGIGFLWKWAIITTRMVFSLGPVLDKAEKATRLPFKVDFGVAKPCKPWQTMANPYGDFNQADFMNKGGDLVKTKEWIYGHSTCSHLVKIEADDEAKWSSGALYGHVTCFICERYVAKKIDDLPKPLLLTASHAAIWGNWSQLLASQI